MGDGALLQLPLWSLVRGRHRHLHSHQRFSNPALQTQGPTRELELASSTLQLHHPTHAWIEQYGRLLVQFACLSPTITQDGLVVNSNTVVPPVALRPKLIELAHHGHQDAISSATTRLVSEHGAHGHTARINKLAVLRIHRHNPHHTAPDVDYARAQQRTFPVQHR